MGKVNTGYHMKHLRMYVNSNKMNHDDDDGGSGVEE